MKIKTRIVSSLSKNRGWCGCLFFLSLLLVLCPGLVRAEEKAVPVSYDLKVVIEPQQGSIRVHGDIAVPVSDPGAKTLQFSLHETFAIRKLAVNGRAVTFSSQPADLGPINPATKHVVVDLPAPILPGKIQLEVDYEGRLRQIPEFGTFADQKQALDDQINSRMVELANYSSWYPQFFVFGYPIDITLEVSLPEGWTAICSGKKLEERENGGRAITRWSSVKDNDILITAAPNYKLKSLALPAGHPEIYYTQLPDDYVEKEGREISAVMNLFTTRFGETTIPSGTVKHVFSPKRKGQGRAGIARPGMIVTSEGRVLEALVKDPNFSLLQDVAHEIAHFWWNFGAGQGDWINEAFAEYSSAIAVEQILSEEKFQSVLESYRREVRELPADAPSLSRASFGGSGFVVRYYKGSLLLDDVRHLLGSDQFYTAARSFFQTYKGKSIGTEEFRSFWKLELGEKKDRLDVWLDSGGGLPELPAQMRKTGAVN